MSAIAKRTVARYFWNGKGYATHRAAAVAIAKKEAVIYCVTLFARKFSGALPEWIRLHTITDTRRSDAYLWTALAFAHIKSNGDGLYFDGGMFRAWVATRATAIMKGAPVLIEKDYDDERGYDSWFFTDPSQCASVGLPLADVDGQFLTGSEMLGVLRPLYEKWTHKYMCDYEKFCWTSGIEFIYANLESSNQAEEFRQKANAEELDIFA